MHETKMDYKNKHHRIKNKFKRKNYNNNNNDKDTNENRKITKGRKQRFC